MKLFPIFTDLTDRTVLVVGGGNVALRKVEALLRSRARVRVGSPSINSSLAALKQNGSIQHVEGEFDASWIDGVWLVIAAVDDADVNRRVAAAAEAKCCFVNVVDDAALSTFHVPAIVDRSPLVIAISSAGAAPMLARWVREQLEILFDQSLGAMASLLERKRSLIRARHRDLGERRSFYERILSSSVWNRLRASDKAGASREFDRVLDQKIPSAGSVVLVGAGPGDAGLLTLRAMRALNEADVILHDRLVSQDVIDMARRDAQRIEVGKSVGEDHDATQLRIHALMLEHARAGRRVVRLKGGDPFIFGRGGEELEFLRANGIDYEVVPGLTAAVACAAYAGVPLTHRDHSQSVRFVTAHGQNSLDNVDWTSLAQERQTLALYMGVAQLEPLRAQLLAHGRSKTTPFALIENGSTESQRVVAGMLDELVELAQGHDVRAPALLIVGEVAAYARTLHWFGEAPIVSADLRLAA